MSSGVWLVSANSSDTVWSHCVFVQTASVLSRFDCFSPQVVAKIGSRWQQRTVCLSNAAWARANSQLQTRRRQFQVPETANTFRYLYCKIKRLFITFIILRHGKLDDSKRKQNFINLNFYSPPNQLDECKLKGLLITTVTSNGQFVFVFCFFK